MRDSRTNYVVVGGFVLVMLAALIVSVALLTGKTGNNDLYTTTLPNVTGIKYGSKVTYEGFVVGQVEGIQGQQRDNRTWFRVTMGVQEGWQVPEGSVARITAPGILAAPTLDIKGGASDVILPPGSEIPGGAAANIFATMNAMAGEVSKLNDQGLLPLMATLNTQVEALGVIMQKQAPELLSNLLVISSDLATKAPRITTDVQKITGTLSGKVLNDENAAIISQTLANTAELTAGLVETRKKLDNVVATIDGNKGSIDQSMKDLRHTLAALARNIDSIAYNLEGTSRNVHEFSRQIRDNPGVLIGGTKGAEDGPGRR
ncbi:MAG: MlaD family protein [Magnetospirillum sp.]